MTQTDSLPNRPRRVDLLREFQQVLQKVGMPGVEARWILTYVLGIDDQAFTTKLLEPVPFDVEEAARAILALRLKGQPLQLLLGETEFYGLRLKVKRGVLIPRPETEGLVELALQLPRPLTAYPLGMPAAAKVLDVGTGSGAIAIAFKHMRSGAEVWASEINPAALELARQNAERLGLEINFLEGAYTAGLSQLELIISNPPYLPEGFRHEAPPELSYEDDRALYSGHDGLEMPRELVRHAWTALLPGGWLVLELAPANIYVLLAEMAELGWRDLRVSRDLNQRPRYLVAQKPPLPFRVADDSDLVVEHEYWHQDKKGMGDW